MGHGIVAIDKGKMKLGLVRKAPSSAVPSAGPRKGVYSTTGLADNGNAINMASAAISSTLPCAKAELL
jgi:hypothetical protein